MLSEIINEDKFVSIVRLKKSIFNLTFKFCSSYEKIYYIASALFISESKLLAFIDDYSTLAEHVRLIDKIDVFIPCSNNTIACAITEPKILGRIDEYCNENAKKNIIDACSIFKNSSFFNIKNIIILTMDLEQIKFKKSQKKIKIF